MKFEANFKSGRKFDPELTFTENANALLAQYEDSSHTQYTPVDDVDKFKKLAEDLDDQNKQADAVEYRHTLSQKTLHRYPPKDSSRCH